MAQQKAKVMTRRRKFINVDVPFTNSKISLVGNSPEELEGKTIKLDLTRQLRGKSLEATFKIKVKDEHATTYPVKLKLLPYFIRRMIRKRISYVEDSFETPSQESMIRIKPFIITRKKVSRVVRKTIRNQARNWLEDYIATKKDDELFSEVLANRMQKPLSLRLKKTYPLSLCEIRIIEIKRALEPNEVPKIKKVEKVEVKERAEMLPEGKSQIEDIEEEIKKQEVKKAEIEIKETQKKASKIEDKEKPSEEKEEKTVKKATKKTTKKKSEVKKEAKPLAKEEEKNE